MATPPAPQRDTTVPQCDTPRVALVHPPRRIGIPPASHWYTHRVALVHAPRRIGTRTASHWYTHRVALVHAPRRIGTRPASHWYAPRVALVHPLRRIGTPTAPHWYIPRVHWYTPRVATRPIRVALGAYCPACVTTRLVPALPLDISHQPTYTYCHNVEDRKISGVGGCRRYGRAGKHIRPVPARELSYLLLPRAPRGVYTPRENINRKTRPRGRDFQPVAARTCRRVVTVTSGLTARIGGYCHE
jgi:hypothetical protein